MLYLVYICTNLQHHYLDVMWHVQAQKDSCTLYEELVMAASVTGTNSQF